MAKISNMLFHWFRAVCVALLTVLILSGLDGGACCGEAEHEDDHGDCGMHAALDFGCDCACHQSVIPDSLGIEVITVLIAVVELVEPGLPVDGYVHGIDPPPDKIS